MPRLVHLAPERLVRRIERAGLRGSTCVVLVDGVTYKIEEGVFAMPVVPDFSVTHQWLRELRRWGRGRMVAVHFSIPAEEPVYVGRYSAEKSYGPARKMIPALLQKPLGAELLVPRRIASRDVVEISRVRQDVGWVETPDTPHKFDCVCVACLPSGTARLKRRIRRAYQAAIAGAKAAQSSDAVLESLSALYLPLERAAAHLPPEPLLLFTRHVDARVRSSAIQSLGAFHSPLVESRLAECLVDGEVSSTAVESLVDCGGPQRAFERVRSLAPHLLLHLVETLRYHSGHTAMDVLNALAASPDPELSQAARSALEEDA